MEFFKIEDKNCVRTVTINNPRKKNALNKHAYFALGEILDAAGKDGKVKAVVLTGTGDFFRFELCTHLRCCLITTLITLFQLWQRFITNGRLITR